MTFSYHAPVVSIFFDMNLGKATSAYIFMGVNMISIRPVSKLTFAIWNMEITMLYYFF